MANPQGSEAAGLIHALQGKSCCGYDFFRVVRALQAALPELPLIGTSRTPQEDPIRFGQRPALAFSPSSLDELIPGEPPKLYVNFLGLLGPGGPLPLHLTQYAIRRQLGHRGEDTGDTKRAPSPDGGNPLGEGYKDHAFADFLDIFHHRMLSLFFRAWAVSQRAVDLDRANHQRFLFFLAALFGEANADLDSELFGDGDVIPLQAKAYYAGRLSCPERNAEGLAAVMQDYFGIATSVQEFVARWFDLPPGDWFRLGSMQDIGRLGQNVIVGSKVWMARLSFRIRMGPMSFRDYCRFLPTGNTFQRLKSWVINYCGTELLWDLQLVLRAAEVPTIRLGKAGLLGWTTWLQTRPFDKDVDDLVLNPETN